MYTLSFQRHQAAAELFQEAEKQGGERSRLFDVFCDWAWFE